MFDKNKDYIVEHKLNQQYLLLPQGIGLSSLLPLLREVVVEERGRRRREGEVKEEEEEREKDKVG